jgi:hypothetical protein
MGFVLISILAIVLGIVFIYLTSEKDIGGDVLGTIGGILLFYGFLSFIPLGAHDDLDTDLNRYEKAKAKLEIMETYEGLPVELICDFKRDIKYANKLIDKSKKYHNNWFLSSFYYEEVADLEKLNTDSVATSVKIF